MNSWLNNTWLTDGYLALGASDGWWATAEGYVVGFVKLIVILAVTWVVSGWAKRLLEGRFQASGFDDTLGKFFAKAAKIAIVVLGTITAVGAVGVQMTSFAALVGAAGLAIGLSLQGSLAHLASGVMLLIFRPFKVGDVITVAGHTGSVTEIDLFVTKLDTGAKRRIILPNGAVFGSTMVNISHHEAIRADVNVGVDYGADVTQVRKVLLEAAGTVEGIVTDPAPSVVLTELGDSAVSWQVRVWCAPGDYWGVLERATETTKLALDKANIGIPYPTMDVNLSKAA